MTKRVIRASAPSNAYRVRERTKTADEVANADPPEISTSMWGDAAYSTRFCRVNAKPANTAAAIQRVPKNRCTNAAPSPHSADSFHSRPLTPAASGGVAARNRECAGRLPFWPDPASANRRKQYAKVSDLRP